MPHSLLQWCGSLSPLKNGLWGPWSRPWEPMCAHFLRIEEHFSPFPLPWGDVSKYTTEGGPSGQEWGVPGCQASSVWLLPTAALSPSLLQGQFWLMCNMGLRCRGLPPDEVQLRIARCAWLGS